MMSITRLEELPNEILSDIFEKYANGIDILMAFAFQLNRRIDGLIIRCQKLNFDFTRCKKDDFRFCVGLLPAYINKIEQLSISDECTPGQIHAFFSFYPSIAQYSRLRKLDLHLTTSLVAWSTVERALASLKHTNIEILSINTMKSKDISLSMSLTTAIFTTKTLKQFHLTSECAIFDIDSLTNLTSNIEHLTLSCAGIEFRWVESISQSLPNLKYLSMTIDYTYELYSNELTNQRQRLKPMTKLRTLILYYFSDNSNLFERLRKYLMVMPSLNSLSIKTTKNRLANANKWKMLIETSSPKLKHFNLDIDNSNYDATDVNQRLRAFQTSYWIEKKNFNITVTTHRLHRDIDRTSDEEIVKDRFHVPVTNCTIAPDRRLKNEMVVSDKITSLLIPVRDSHLLSTFYCTNVVSVTLDDIENPKIEIAMPHLEYSKVRNLTLAIQKIDKNILESFLSYFSNIDSLSMPFDLLINNTNMFMRKKNNIKSLDLSATQHRLKHKNIAVISKNFHYLEHIKINTNDLHNIPLFKKHLPCLRSLTYVAEGKSMFASDTDTERYADEQRQKCRFLLYCSDRSVTIWLDDDVYEDEFWRISVASNTVDYSESKSDKKNSGMKKIYSSLRNFFQ